MKRRLAFTAEKFLDPVEALDGDEELVCLGILELQILAMRAIGFEKAHPRESRDPVVDVDHELARREVERELACQLVCAGS